MHAFTVRRYVGPGLSSMNFPQASRFINDRDLVLVGYRGRDGSVQLDCPEVPAALKRSTDALSEASFRAYGDAFQACANRLTSEWFDLAQYGLPQQVDDLETARVAPGYGRIDLLSRAGTRTALIFGASGEVPASMNGLAPFTAVIGAAAGGNLTVVALDIAAARQVRSQFTNAPGSQTREALGSLS